MLEKKTGFGFVSKDVLTHRDLTAEAKAIYCLLSCYADKDTGICYPSVKSICYQLCMNERRFRRHLQLLKSYGVIEVNRERTGNIYGRSIYRITHIIQSHQNGTIENHRMDENGCIDHTVLNASKSDSTILKASDSRPIQNSGTNNTSHNYTSQTLPDKNNITQTTVSTLYERVCSLLNRAKKAYGSKGRLKESSAGYMLRELFESGFSLGEIEAEAVEYAEFCISNHRDADWSSFVKFSLDRKKKNNSRH